MKTLEERWASLHFREIKVETDGGQHHFEIPVWLDGLNPKTVRVELYADADSGGSPERREMTCVRPSADSLGACIYAAAVPAVRPPANYTARVIANFEGVAAPLEEARGLWQR